MNKSDLIDTLSKETNLTKSKSEQVVELFFDEISNTLAQGDRVEIRGLCSIYVKDYKGYTGRNPKTGEPRHVPPKKLPFFKCGKELKGRVDWSMQLVFQYGSNTSTKRMNSSNRLQGDACPVGIAYTEDDFELGFTVWSTGNKCAAADIVPGSGRKIWGVLYEIPEYLIRRNTSGKRKSLDAIEDEGKNYVRMNIALRYPDGSPVDRSVITYVVKNRKSGLQTSLDYARHIIDGLGEHGIPKDYIEYAKERVIVNNPTLKVPVQAL